MNHLSQKFLDKSYNIAVKWKRPGKITPDKLSLFCSYIRQYLENENLKDKYPVIKTYLDWMQHAALDAKQHAHLLKSATRSHDFIACTLPEGEGSDAFTEIFIEEGLCVVKIFNELFDLMKNKPPLKVFNHRNVILNKAFIVNLFIALENKELRSGDYIFKKDGNIDINKCNEIFPNYDFAIPLSLDFEILPQMHDAKLNRLVCHVTTLNKNSLSIMGFTINIFDLNKKKRPIFK